MLKNTDDIKNLENSLNETLNSFEKKSSENEPQIRELKEKIESIDSVISEVAAKKDGINSKIKNKQFLRAYNYIRSSRKKGKVIGFVTNEERNCTICYQVLQPQVINSIRKAREIIYCRNCGSILIWKDQLVENV
jgi:predicted  nucleic acid-binding Zn-ribbon protein